MERNQRETSFLLGKRLARPPSSIWTGHRDGTPRPLESKEGGGEGMSPQDRGGRGEHRVGEEMKGTGELQVKILQEDAVLPVRGSAGAAGYDLCAAGRYVIPSPGKGTMENTASGSTPSRHFCPYCTTFRVSHSQFHQCWRGSSRFGLSGRDQSGFI